MSTPEANVNTTDATATTTTGTVRAARKPRASKKAAKKAAANSRIVHATLPKRACKVTFRVGKKVIYTSPVYNSSNTEPLIIRFARSCRGLKNPPSATVREQLKNAVAKLVTV